MEPTTALPAERASLNRLGIFSQDGSTLGYVLLPVPSDPARTQNTPDANARLEAAYSALTLSSILGPRAKAFVWATERMFTEPEVFTEVPNLAGLLLSPWLAQRPDASDQVMRMRELHLACILADFTGTPGQVALLPFVHYVTINFRRDDAEELAERATNANVAVIASQTYNRARLKEAWQSGAQFAIGTVYKASPNTTKPMTPGELQCLSAIRLLNEDSPDLNQVADILSTDPEIMLRVLHLVNSASTGVSQRVDSIHRAAVLLGPARIGPLVMASLISARVHNMDALWFLLTRAAACRELSRDDAGYTTGLISALAYDSGIDAETLVSKTRVSPEVTAAVLHGEGRLGQALRAVVAHEIGNYDAIRETGYSIPEVAGAYLTALPWALNTLQDLYTN